MLERRSWRVTKSVVEGGGGDGEEEGREREGGKGRR